MKHAILGAGGVGGLLGGVLAAAGDSVTMILRHGTLADYPARLHVDRPSGTTEVPVARAAIVPDVLDVLWVTVKATQLPDALELVPPTAKIEAVVPLLNGIDHVSLLRARFGHDCVVPAAIRVEAERVAPGRIVQRSPHCHVEFSAVGESRLAPVAASLREADIPCEFRADEMTLLWRKLAMLAPFALVTSAAAEPIGAVLGDPQWRARLEAATREAARVAFAEGAQVDADVIIAGFPKVPATMQSSMQKDVAAGREPELDAIAGPILRGGAKHHIDVPATAELMALVAEKFRAARNHLAASPQRHIC